MATRTAEAITVAGTIPTSYNAASGDKFTPDDNAFIWVTNGGGSSITATFTVPGTNDDGQPNPDPAITIAAGVTKAIRVFRRWADPSDGLVALTWSSTTTVTYFYARV